MTKIATYEGIIENGFVKLSEGVNIPEKTRVYVVVPAAETNPPHVASPRLVDSERTKDFEMQVIADTSNHRP